MSKKNLTGLLIIFAVGVIALSYKRKKNKINEAAANAYKDMSRALKRVEKKTRQALS